MQNIIQKYLKKSNKSPLILKMIYALILGRHVSSGRCAICFPGNIKTSSKVKQIERFYAKNYLDQDAAVHFLTNCMNLNGSVLSIDRTNWQHGNIDINALVVYGVNKVTSGMLNLELLENKGGNSNIDDRKRVLGPVFAKLGAANIKALLCDREFFSFEFAHYLIKANIPFVIRIKENLKFIQRFLRFFRGPKKTWRNQIIGKFNGEEIKVDISVKKLKDEYLLTVSYKVNNPLKLYRKRWYIECFFRSIKSSGFNVEATHMTNMNRLRSLFLLCGMAYLISTLFGILKHQTITKIRFKKTIKYKQFSFFRYGLDWITEIIFSNAVKMLDYCDIQLKLSAGVR